MGDKSHIENQFDQDPYVKMAQIGIDLEVLLGNRVGKYLVDKAKTQMDSAIEQMLILDPDDNRATYRKHRMDALVAQQALSWISEGITEGKLAIQELNKQDGFTDN